VRESFFQIQFYSHTHHSGKKVLQLHFTCSTAPARQEEKQARNEMEKNCVGEIFSPYSHTGSLKGDKKNIIILKQNKES
jgi:hypothetical protein